LGRFQPNTLSDRETGAAQNPPTSECCIPAPSVIEFDPKGNVLQGWGNQDTTQQWFVSEHGIFVDNDGNVWIGGNSTSDQIVLKFSNNGKLLLQIGEWGVTKGSNDTEHLGGPTDIAVDAIANEVYIADGYVNRRIIIFDAKTGEYKRHWGAYGEVPDDSELPAYNPNDEPIRSFGNPVHAVRLSFDNLVYMADRSNNRIQVFMKDGTFIRESFVAIQTLGAGSVWDIELSPDADQKYMYIADGMNMKVWILDRLNLEVVGSFGQGGRNAGQFGWIHNIAVDSKGNLYTTEVSPGKRVQKFRPVTNSTVK
jgi:DNA-binding beta-propeller fold protein YncE